MMKIMRNYDVYKDDLGEEFLWMLYKYMSDHWKDGYKVFRQSSNTWDLFMRDSSLGYYNVN